MNTNTEKSNVQESTSPRRRNAGQPLFAPSERFTLNHRSPVPLYHQVEQLILQRIAREDSIGRMLPREMDLMAIFGVSRATIKKAADSLAAKGMIQRRRAIGTEVVRDTISEDLGVLRSYSEQMLAMGLTVSSRTIYQGINEPDPLLSKKLQLSPGEKTLCIRRLRGTSEVFPVVLLHSELPMSFGFDPRDDYEHSLYDRIEKEYQIPIIWAEVEISARYASAEEAGLLDLTAGDVVLVMERLVFTSGDRPLEYVRAVYRPDRYKFTIRLKR